MRLVFAQLYAWFGLMSGGLIAQRRCAEGLAALGHECHAIVRCAIRPAIAIHETTPSSPRRVKPEPRWRSAASPSPRATGESSSRSAASACARSAARTTRSAIRLAQHLRALEPDWVHISDIDDGPPFFETCHANARGRLVAHLHSISYLPFGPLAMHPHDPNHAAELLTVRGAICPSAFGRDYVHAHSAIDAVALYYDTYGRGPFPPRPTASNPGPGSRLRHVHQPVQHQGAADLPRHGGRASRRGVRGRAHVGAQTRGARRARRAAQRLAAPALARHRRHSDPHPRPARAGAVARDVRDGDRRGHAARHSGARQRHRRTQ